jgi:hypothetical protein
MLRPEIVREWVHFGLAEHQRELATEALDRVAQQRTNGALPMNWSGWGGLETRSLDDVAEPEIALCLPTLQLHLP